MIRSISCLLAAVPVLAQTPATFEVEAGTIAQVHDAMKAGISPAALASMGLAGPSSGTGNSIRGR